MNRPDPAHVKAAFLNRYRDEHNGSVDGALEAYSWWLNPYVTCLTSLRARGARCARPCEFCVKQAHAGFVNKPHK